MTARAFDAAMPSIGGAIVAVYSLLFRFSSLVGTTYVGETAFSYLLGTRIKIPFRWVHCGMVVIGATVRVKVAWSVGAILNGLMTLTNQPGWRHRPVEPGGWVGARLLCSVRAAREPCVGRLERANSL